MRANVDESVLTKAMAKKYPRGSFHQPPQTTLYYPAFRILTDNSVDVRQFSFDGNHGPLESNEDVYRSAVLPKLQETIQTNGMLTIMAYGQTGSGKTYTMSAIAHQIVNDLPLELPDMETQAIFSIIEIQGDNLRDLAVAHPVAVSPNATPPSISCKVLLDANGQPKLMGVQELVVTTKQEVMDCFQHGFDMVRVQSSRTHFMCIINIKGGNGMNIEIKIVGLAGSETGSDKKEYDAVRLKVHILNPSPSTKSLMSLKDCIRATSALLSNGEPKDNSSSSCILFRSSKLTCSSNPPSTLATHMAILALAALNIADIPHTFNTYRHIKLERWISPCFENRVTLTQLLGPKGDTVQFGKVPERFVPLVSKLKDALTHLHTLEFKSGETASNKLKTVLTKAHFHIHTLFRRKLVALSNPRKSLYDTSVDEWIQNVRQYAKFEDVGVVKGDGMTTVDANLSVLALEEENEESTSAAVPLAPTNSATKNTTLGGASATPMSWSRLKLERGIDTGFGNQVSLTQLMGPKGDPMKYRSSTSEQDDAFVLPPWKFLYSMSKREVLDGLGVRNKADESVLISVDDGGVGSKVGEKLLTRAEVAMETLKAKGAALRDRKLGDSKEGV
ncbi:hypothetical protein HDU98_008547 [Podochytrium sp. JEL0797]|nr:hypothetical protein HDU98_008547 [Podochytrium sp. JEL0797]